MDFTNIRIGQIKPSETLAVKAKAADLKKLGRSIIDLSAGEPSMDTPQFIKEAACRALEEGHTKYTNVAGILELREAIAEKLRKENSIKADAESVIVANGGKQAIYSFFDVILDEGDEVIIPAPYWVSYPPAVELCRGKPVILHARPENGLKITPAELKARMNERTKCVIINSPSNPCGVTYDAAELRELGKVIAEYPRCLVMSDEIYEKIVFGGFKFTSFAAATPEIADRVFTVNGFSKSYSMTGWRLGYAHGPLEIIKAMGRHQSQTTSNVCSFAQYGALAAITGSNDFVKGMAATYEIRMAEAISKLIKVDGLKVECEPKGAFYIFLNFKNFLEKNPNFNITGSAQFAEYLLDKVGVACVPGEAFGDNFAVRLSVTASEQQLNDGIERIVSALS